MKKEPTLLIGLGGTGGNVIKEIARRVEEHAAAEKTRFIAIDTDEPEETVKTVPSEGRSE